MATTQSNVDSLVTVTFCGVFLLALWKMNRNNRSEIENRYIETPPSSPDTELSTFLSTVNEQGLHRNQSCFVFHDCFGDAVYGNWHDNNTDSPPQDTLKSVAHRSPTPGLTNTTSMPDFDTDTDTHFELDTQPCEEKWEILGVESII